MGQRENRVDRQRYFASWLVRSSSEGRKSNWRYLVGILQGRCVGRVALDARGNAISAFLAATPEPERELPEEVADGAGYLKNPFTSGGHAGPPLLIVSVGPRKDRLRRQRSGFYEATYPAP